MNSISKEQENLIKGNLVLVLDNSQKVIQMLSPESKEAIKMPKGGAVIVALGVDDKMANTAFINSNFKTGDVAKFRINGELKTIDEISRILANASTLALNQVAYSTVENPKIEVSGKLSSFKAKSNYKVAIKNGEKSTVLKLKKDNFSTQIALTEGANYITVELQDKQGMLDKRNLVVYYKQADNVASERIMWVEQFPNAKTLLTEADVEDVILKSKEIGITAFGLDVKGPEGYVSYRKNDLSNSPYYSEIKAEKKKNNPELHDLLQTFITISHKHGMKVYASFNIFTEGNIVPMNRHCWIFTQNGKK